MHGFWLRHTAPALFLALAGACSESSHYRADSDAGTDAGAADDGGVEPAARAHVRTLSAEDIVPRHDGQGARPGDIELGNELVAFVIAGPGVHDASLEFPGWLVDAELRTRVDEPAYDGVDELIPQVNGCPVYPEELEITRDGTGGGAVEVRVSGRERAIPYIINLLDTEPVFRGLDIEVRYRLEPDSRALEIVTTVVNPLSTPVQVAVGDFALLDSDEASSLSLPAGFDVQSSATEVQALGIAHSTLRWVALLHGGDVPLTIRGGSIRDQMGGGDGGLWQYEIAPRELGPGERLVRRRYLTLGRDVAEANAHRLEVTSAKTGRVHGQVTMKGRGVPGARVSLFEVNDQGSFVAQALTDESGIFSAVVEAGRYSIVASGRGDGEHVVVPDRPHLLAEGIASSSIEEIEIEANKDTLRDLSLPLSATLTVHVRDDSGAPIPAKVSFLPQSALKEPWIAIGEREPYPDERIAFIYWSLDGEVEAVVPPGSYSVVASRGPSYSLDSKEAVLSPGAHDQLELTIARRVSHTGWVEIDSHVHGHDSQHGGASRAERVITAITEGLDVAVATDHDFIADYRPVVAALDAEARLLPIAGVELSRPLNHHHNIWPLRTAATESRGGALRWWLGGDLEDAYDYFEARGGIVFQISHGQQTFRDAGYDPTTGTVAVDADFSFRSNAMELQSGKGDRTRSVLVPIWYSLLNTGHRLAPLGASDSHARTPEAGSARTFVRLDDAELAADAVARAVAAQRTVASSGPFVLLQTADGSLGVGETATLATASALPLRIEVSAPEWMALDRVRLIENGTVLHEWDGTTSPAVTPPAANAPAFWFRHELEVQPASDSWYAVEVSGTSSLGPVYPRATPWAHTAPLWVDVE